MNSLTDKVLGENGLVGKAGSIFADKVNGVWQLIFGCRRCF